MPKRSNDYWKKRFEAIEAASNGYGHEAFKRIEPAFTAAQREIEKEIEAWYGRFAKNNQITMQEARRLLNSKELKELRWDVDEYIKYGRENDLNSLWIKELENASARVHVNRLEALKIRTQHAAEVAFGNELDEVDAMARQVFTEDYYHSIFEVQKGFGLGWEIGQVDERKLKTIISKPWTADGKNFSDRIWSSRTQLVTELHNQLTRTVILGKAPDDAIDAISKKFNTSKNQAGRLVMTEQAYFHSVAQKEAFKDLDVEEFEIVATLDSHTSPVCQDMDGKHFPMSEYEPGVTAPPFHVWCRSVTVPYFEDNYTGERAARDANGKTYYVPDSMSYKDWKKGMVDGDTEDLQKVLSAKVLNNKDSKLLDVTKEYEQTAKPGEGQITFGDGYRTKKHHEEIDVADWLHNTYGGNIKLIGESNDVGVLTADYIWNDKLWELKTTSTLNATDLAVRKALKQIVTNPGGIILDYKEQEINVDKLQEVIIRRLVRSEIGDVDIIIKQKNKTIKVLRYKK